ncbi:hypothetical protein FHX71_000562 [Promicromonospora sukumoe]|uniref:Uncharacterized protein n=1 Tax=Promicromonospora sukumoe TaxID=88382 RepID=A0A7W3J5F1_9MICO|nr:hypothetical protein [Promicromonospora sukumoe]
MRPEPQTAGRSSSTAAASVDAAVIRAMIGTRSSRRFKACPDVRLKNSGALSGAWATGSSRSSPPGSTTPTAGGTSTSHGTVTERQAGPGSSLRRSAFGCPRKCRTWPALPTYGGPHGRRRTRRAR